jgi:putrescine transport system substrate-binding protein
MMTRLLSLTLVSVALASPVAAQQTLNIYNWSDYIAEDTITKFEEATGIKVVYDVYDSNEVLEAKLLAGSSGYDLVVPTSNFLQRQVKAGIYMPLEKAKIPNLANLDPGLMKSAAAYDVGNAHSAIYLWGTTGIGYNIDKVAERLGDAAPTDSWSLVLDPANAAKLADCGISILDSAVEVMPGVLAWLGLPPDSTDPDDIEKAMAALTAIRPYVRYFHSSQYITDLANGEVCLSIGWSGDVFIAMDRAAEAGNGVNIGYTIPSEGTLQWFDMMAIPADAPHPDAAHAFINFVLQPEIIADITNYVFYPNAVPASKEMIDPEITGDPAIYPPQEVLDKLFPATVYDARTDRMINRLWTQVRTGQ